MKKIIAGLFLALCSLMLLSCGESGQEGNSSALQASTAAVETTATAEPETDIDDSLSFYAL